MKKFILVFLLLFSQVSFSQPLRQDAWLWMTASVDKKITKRWSVGFDEELRLFDNISRVNLFFSNIGVNYRIKSFKFSLVYRLVNKNQDDQYYSKRHRLYVDAAYKYKLNLWTFNYRLRAQGQVRDYYSSDDGKYIESYLRHKFEIDYDFNKFTPYVAAEFRFQLNNPSFKEANDLWNRMRFYLGCNYEFNKVHSMGIYYMVQHDFNNKRLENDFTIGIQYGLSL